MTRYIVVLAFLAFVITSCSGESEQEVFVFDPSKDYPEFPLSLSDIADVSYIKMGGAEEGINLISLWSSGIFIDDSHGRIFASDPGIGVMEFDMTGRFLRKIGHPGRGPGEYGTANFYVQPEEEKVGVYDDGKERFLVFKYDGTFLPLEGLSKKMYVASSQCFLIQNGNLVFFNPLSSYVREDTGKSYSIGKRTLELIPMDGKGNAAIKDIHFENPALVSLGWGNGGRNIMSVGNLFPLYSGLAMATYRSDTTYVIGNDFSWRPFLVNVRHNGVAEGCLYPAAETKDYLFLCQQDNQQGAQMFYFAIDKKTKQAYKITADDSCPLPGPLQGKVQIRYRGFTKNKEYRFWEFRAEDLKEECYGYLPDELKVLVDQCDEDSNPILMIIKLKD